SRLWQDLPIVLTNRDILPVTDAGDFPMISTRPTLRAFSNFASVRLTWLVTALSCIAWSSVGCNNPETRQTALDAALTDIPAERQKVSIPPYRVEPPDILSIEAGNNIRPANDLLRAGDELVIRASNTLPIDPMGDPVQNEFKQINGAYRVQTDGTVDLGP